MLAKSDITALTRPATAENELLFLPFLTLQVADIVTTTIAMQFGFTEANPLGFSVRTILIKMAVVALNCLFIQSGRAPRAFVWWITALTGAVVTWNCGLLLFAYLYARFLM